ncbi:MAG: aldo/keto reductase [Gammaproteobacteria bacterium]|nr:aldo/keto reductase [Gammaproteobacteria bacterium]
MGTSRTFNADITNGSVMDRLQEVLTLFYAMGGRLLDTSPMYDKAEQVSGHLVKQLGIENKLFTATKVWTYGEQSGVEQMQSSFDLLADKPLDLMQIHNLRDWKIHMKTLRGWKEKGIIRYIGITHYRTDAFDDLEKIMQTEDLDWVQLNYSIATRKAEEKLLPLAQDKGIATMINRPFERGALFKKIRGKKLPEWIFEYDINSWGQFFLKYILSHRAVTSVIPATSKPRHMKDNMSAGIGVMLDSQGLKKMKNYFEQL